MTHKNQPFSAYQPADIYYFRTLFWYILAQAAGNEVPRSAALYDAGGPMRRKMQARRGANGSAGRAGMRLGCPAPGPPWLHPLLPKRGSSRLPRPVVVLFTATAIGFGDIHI